MKIVCSKVVHKILSPEHKASGMNICADIMKTHETKPNTFGKGDSMWWVMIFHLRSAIKATIDALEEPQITKAKKSSDKQIKIQSYDDHIFLTAMVLFT